MESETEGGTAGEYGGTLHSHPLIEAELTEKIIGAAVAVHRELGPGLLESAYQICVCHELALRKIPFRSQVD